MNIAELRDKLNAIASEIAETEVQQVEAVAEENIEEGMKTLKCKDCGDMLGNPTTQCEHDSQDPKGDNWIMIDADNDGDMDIAVANEEEFAEEDELEVQEDEVTEEEVEETVEVPVAALAELMQLAGYSNYADKLAEYENEPEEEYMDAEDQLVGLSGGLNGPKDSFDVTNGADNPMKRVAEDEVSDALYKSYKDFLEEQEIKQED